jgi:hypothetical protein
VLEPTNRPDGQWVVGSSKYKEMEPALDANKGKAVVHVLACVLEKLVAANNTVRRALLLCTPPPPRSPVTSVEWQR